MRLSGFIAPLPALPIITVIAATVSLAEYGISRSNDGDRVRMANIPCVGREVVAGSIAVSLTVRCGNQKATVTDPEMIQRYVVAPATRFRCDLRADAIAVCEVPRAVKAAAPQSR